MCLNVGVLLRECLQEEEQDPEEDLVEKNKDELNTLLAVVGESVSSVKAMTVDEVVCARMRANACTCVRMLSLLP